MSNPRLESPGPARGLQPAHRLLTSALQWRLRASEPRQTSRSPLPPRREPGPATHVALPVSAPLLSSDRAQRKNPAATTGHHRRGWSRVATALHSRAAPRSPHLQRTVARHVFSASASWNEEKTPAAVTSPGVHTMLNCHSYEYHNQAR